MTINSYYFVVGSVVVVVVVVCVCVCKIQRERDRDVGAGGGREKKENSLPPISFQFGGMRLLISCLFMGILKLLGTFCRPGYLDRYYLSLTLS